MCHFYCSSFHLPMCFFLFFFNDTATTEIYTLSLHDALPISAGLIPTGSSDPFALRRAALGIVKIVLERNIPLSLSDRKSTRLNSSHGYISYAVFCLKKKKKQ